MSKKEKPELVTLWIKYNLNHEELTEISKEISQIIGKIDNLENEKKAAMAEFKSQIDSSKSRLNEIARQHSQGYDWRNFDCEMIVDNVEKMVKYYRPDTGELVKSRKFTADEKQQGLFE